MPPNPAPAKRILVIDDDPDMRESLAKVLEAKGHEVIVAGDGQEGMAAFRAHSPDLVITDLVMPRKEGLETIMELRRDHPNTRIIAMSGGTRHDETVFLRAAQKLGAHRWLQKPFGLDQLLGAVNDLLNP